MLKSLTEMAAEIVAAQAGHAAMSAEDMNATLRKTFEALQSIKAKEESPEAVAEEAPAVEPEKSIRRNKVICLECGKEFKQLTNRHLREHGIDAREYRRKYGFSARQPLSARSLTAKRRKTAKEFGLGERLQKARKTKEKPAKKRAPRRKKVTEEAAAEN